MSLCLRAESKKQTAELKLGYSDFMRLRLGFLERVDGSTGLGLFALYELRLKAKHLFSDEESCVEFVKTWNNACSKFNIKTRLHRKYGLAPKDIDAVTEFAWHNDSEGTLSVDDCKTLAKWLSLFIEVESKREEQGEDNPFWIISKCEIIENNQFGKEIVSDGISRLYDIVSFAVENKVPIQFI